MADFFCGMTLEVIGNADDEADTHQNCLSDNVMMLKLLGPSLICYANNI